MSEGLATTSALYGAPHLYHIVETVRFLSQVRLIVPLIDSTYRHGCIRKSRPPRDALPSASLARMSGLPRSDALSLPQPWHILTGDITRSAVVAFDLLELVSYPSPWALT